MSYQTGNCDAPSPVKTGHKKRNLMRFRIERRIKAGHTCCMPVLCNLRSRKYCKMGWHEVGGARSMDEAERWIDHRIRGFGQFRVECFEYRIKSAIKL